METSLPSASDVKIGNTVESKVSNARLSTDTEHRRRCNTRDELKEARRRINAFWEDMALSLTLLYTAPSNDLPTYVIQHFG